MYQDCEPCSGPRPSQWLFLGASVISFSCNQSYGANATTLTVNLVEDPQSTCDGRTKKYVDASLNVADTTDPDPGFFGIQQNIIGVPVFFKFEQFEFCGLLQTWNENVSATDGNEYVVQVVSPGLILEATNIILDEEIRPTNYAPNIANVYGFYETNIYYDNDPCENLGESGNFRGQGMKWNTIKLGISTLAGIYNPPTEVTDYLQNGRIKYVAGLGGGHGLIPESDTGYLLDLEELPLAPSYYRFSGQNTKLLDMIEVLSADFGFDWWVELTPAKSEGKIYKFIKIRIADRTIPPAPDSIEQFVQERIESDCGVENYMIGEEERDNELHTVLIGPNREQIYFVDWQRESTYQTVQNPVWSQSTGEEFEFEFYKRDKNGAKTKETTTIVRNKWEYVGAEPINVYDLSNDFISPYWGLDVNNNAIQSVTIDWWGGNNPPIPNSIYEVANWNPARDTYCHFPANSSSLSGKMFLLNVPYNYIELSEGELLAALSGQDSWESWISGAGAATHILVTVTRTVLQIGAAGGKDDMRQLVSNPAFYGIPANFLKPVHMISTRRISGQEDIYEKIESDIRTLYEWVLRYAQEFYGLKFQIRVPDVCVVQDPETLQFKANFELADGFGWNEWNDVEFNNLLGLPIPSPEIDFFRDDSGRIGPIMKFTGAQNLIYDNLSPDEYGYFDPGFGGLADLWIKCNVEGICFGDYENLLDPRVIVSIPQAVRYKNQSLWSEEVGMTGWSVNPATVLAGSFGGISLKDRINEKGAIINSTQGNYMERCAQPRAVSFALKNNENTYGPWWYTNGSPVAGKVRFEQDNGLTPWNYQGMANLQSVAIQQAASTVSNMYYAEAGTVTIPTLPTGRPGDELKSVNGSGYISGQFFVSSRATVARPSALLGYTANGCNLIAGGYWKGNLGPNITSMRIDVGEQGYRTTYSLTTYSPQLIAKSKVKVNRLKELAKLRQDSFRNG